jgi:hypothetical protein
MFKTITAIILTLSLCPTLLAMNNYNNYLDEKDRVLFSAEDQSFEKTWKIHHPGLYRWQDAQGCRQQRWDVPGCFIISSQEGKNLREKIEEFAQALDFKNSEHCVPRLINADRKPAFYDFDVKDYYVTWYRLGTKSGLSFGQVYKQVFGDLKPQFTISFSRGCITSEN